MELINLNDEKFDDLVSKGIVVVDFYANWCGPCKILEPIIEKLSQEIDDVKFIKVDVDKHEEIARIYGIMSIPTLIFFKNGKQVNKHIGLISYEQVKKIVDEI